MESKGQFFNLIKNFKVISIIGMAKNVGKTTTLNHIIYQMKEERVLGLTSIGRDGEVKDILSCKPKPDIYIQKGTIIATAIDCLGSGDFTKEILFTSGINTPMGEIIILKALSSGFVELGGPSIGKQLYKIINKMKLFGSDLILIDGAFDRKFFASPTFSEGTILVTGAAYSKNIDRVITDTKNTVEILMIPPIKEKKLINKIKKSKDLKIGIFDDNYNCKRIDIKTILDSAKLIAQNIEENTKYIYLEGVITNRWCLDLMKITNKFKDVTFLIKDATKLFIDKEIFEKFTKKGGIFRVINAINIIGVVANPYSLADNFSFDKYEFLNLLDEKLKKINIPVYDLGAKVL